MRSPKPLKLMSEVPSTQRVVYEGFDEFLRSPFTDFHEDNLCVIELNPSIQPTIQDTQEKTRKGETPKNSIGNSCSSATAANPGGPGNSGNACVLKLVRNSTDLITFNRYVGYTNSLLGLLSASSVTNYLDSPATTSATTYKCQFKNEVAASYVYVQGNNDVSTMTLMEIAA